MAAAERESTKQLQRAFRFRARIIGPLTSCICGYPIVRYETSTLHRESCPGHLTILGQREVAARFGVEVEDVDGPMCRICGCVDGDCTNCIRRTGLACSWVEHDLCSACAQVAEQLGELDTLGKAGLR